MDTLLYFNRIPKTGSENFAFLIDQLAKVINSLLKLTSLKIFLKKFSTMNSYLFRKIIILIKDMANQIQDT